MLMVDYTRVYNLMDTITMRTQHTVATICASGSFTTSPAKFAPLKDKVILQLTHPSGVVEVSTCDDSKRFIITNTTRYYADDHGPKQANAGSPWVGSVESGSDIKDVYANGTVILSPHKPSIIDGEVPPANVVTIPGGKITLTREGGHVNTVVTSSLSIPDPATNPGLSMPPPPAVSRVANSPQSLSASGSGKRKRKHREVPAMPTVPSELPAMTTRELEMACSMIAATPDGIELDFSDA